jgi:hypothetical protein
MTRALSILDLATKLEHGSGDNWAAQARRVSDVHSTVQRQQDVKEDCGMRKEERALVMHGQSQGKVEEGWRRDGSLAGEGACSLAYFSCESWERGGD